MINAKWYIKQVICTVRFLSSRSYFNISVEKKKDKRKKKAAAAEISQNKTSSLKLCESTLDFVCKTTSRLHQQWFHEQAHVMKADKCVLNFSQHI